MIQSISKSQEDVNEFLNQTAEVLLKVNQINRSVKDMTHTVNEVSESQDSTKNILKDLYDIINDMNRDKDEHQDFELLQKIDDISKRMTQVNHTFPVLTEYYILQGMYCDEDDDVTLTASELNLRIVV